MAVTSPAGMTPADPSGDVFAPRPGTDRHPSALDALRQVGVLVAATGLTVAALIAISSAVASWG